MAFIYVIYNYDNDKIYVGSTTGKYISLRLAQHKYYFKQYKKGKKIATYSSVELFEDEDGEHQCYCDFVADVSNEEVKQLESFYIYHFRECGFNVVNKNDAIYDKEKYRIKRKIKYQENKEELKAKSSIYYWKNKEKVLLKSKIKRNLAKIGACQ